ncbi:molybdopterin molybdenumtransferase [Nocardioides baekrokdamisoli]|uniref:Molybdopterin molybdenumtransferase n=1 Tax=Nocardioides baekrokdamisoli TaxID=1804624 RepID=A0A3G9IZU9_9ACTN|nr:gephyrin-like molybdotransferase Glp [Nocardioides baekrokdamisoli]BBH16898.1 molybdopterin molybdenumtransferase [Nocardioides baekrokdamisoli]
MLSPQEYLEQILRDLTANAPIQSPLRTARGTVLAEDVRTPIPLPIFDNSAMDGYALRLADLTGTTLPVAGESAAGSATATLPPGCAMKVMTGAPIPIGADCVVPYEATDRGTVSVTISERPTLGAHIRRQGEDLQIGDVVAPRGAVLTPRHMAAIAAVGIGEVVAHATPMRVSVVSTGAELRQPGEDLTDGAIYESNSLMLAELVRGLRAEAETSSVTDDPELLLEHLTRQATHSDLIITTGGVSAGDYDVVKAALAPLGIWFGPVAMQPGKPQGFGRLNGTPILCLPGNPVSAYVSFVLFVRPALRKLMGHPDPVGHPIRARLAHEMTSPAGKTQFLRGAYADGIVSQVRGPGSHLIGALAAANALVEIPAEATILAAGTDVNVWLMETD